MRDSYFIGTQANGRVAFHAFRGSYARVPGKPWTLYRVAERIEDDSTAVGHYASASSAKSAAYRILKKEREQREAVTS